MKKEKKLILPAALGAVGLLIGGAGAATAYWVDAADAGNMAIQSGDLKVEITGLPTITHDCDGKAEQVPGGTAFVEPGEAYKVSYPIRVTAEGKNIAVKVSGNSEVVDKTGKKIEVVHDATEGFLVKSVKADGKKMQHLAGLSGRRLPRPKC